MDKFTLQISYSNFSSIIGYQFDLILPSSLSYDSYNNIHGRYTDHQVMLTRLNDSTLRVLCFSLSNSPINNRVKPLINIILLAGEKTGTFTPSISNAILVSSSGENILDSVKNGKVTIRMVDGINGKSSNSHSQNTNQVRIYPNPFNDSANISFYSNSLQPLKIELYDLNGNRILCKKVLPGAIGWNTGVLNIGGTSSGLYIIALTQDEVCSFNKIVHLK